MPVIGNGKSEHSTNGGRLDDGAEGLIVIDFRPPCEATKDPSCLVSVKGVIGVKLVLENPFASDNVGVAGLRNKLPRAVGLERGEFFLIARRQLGSASTLW